MTDTVIDFPKPKTLENVYENIYALDMELTDLIIKAIELEMPVFTIIGIMQKQIHFLIDLEEGHFDDDEE